MNHPNNTSETTLQADADAWPHNARLFREWEGMKHDILLHKWYESERAGHDIGWERAMVRWMIAVAPRYRAPRGR